MGYDCGTAAGLLAGAFTESTVIGTAGNTISRLGLPEAETTRLLNNIPVAYAVSYLVGTSFVVWFLSSLAPRLLRVDLKEESRKLEARRTPDRRPRPGRARPTASGTCGRSASRWRGPGARVGGRRGVLRAGPRLPGAAEAGERHPRGHSGHAPPARRRGGRRGAPARAPRPRAIPSGRRSRTATCSTSRWRRSTSSSPAGKLAERPLAEIARGARSRRRPPEARPRGRGDPLRAGHGRQPRGPAPAGRAPSRTSSGRGRRSATWSGRRARRTSSSWASGSCSAGSSARSPCGWATFRSASPPAAAPSSWGSCSAGCAPCAPPSGASRSPPSGSSTRSAWPSSSGAWASAPARASWPACARPGRASWS